MGFESGLHHLKSSLSGSRGLQRQMVTKFLVAQVQENHSPQRCFVISKAKICPKYLEAVNLADKNGAHLFYSRCLLRGRTFFSCAYNRGITRSDRYIYYLNDGNPCFGKVIFFFQADTSETFSVVRTFHILSTILGEANPYPLTSLLPLLSKSHVKCQPSSKLTILPVHWFVSSCCALTLHDQNVVLLSPLISDFEMQ